MSAEKRTLAYIAATSRDISERLTRDSEQQIDVHAGRLSEDVAWIARQLAIVAEIIAYPEPQ